MKKLLILFVMLIPLIVLSQGQPAANNLGVKSTMHFDPSSGNRSIPPGTIVWSQLPTCENAYACQSALNFPFDAQAADDFIFTSSPGQITAVRWWLIWYLSGYAPYVAPSSFNILIYDDNSCIPGNLVASWNIPFANANEDAGCSVYYDSREYWAALSPAFNPLPGQHYWIVTQPVMDFPPQTMVMESLTSNLCSAIQIFPEAGIPAWTAINSNLAFELYATPPSVIPVSSWALLLGGVLICAAIFLRYRRIS